MSKVQVDLDSQGWRKSRHSMANGNCVEIQSVGDSVAVRDSQNKAGSVLAYSAQTWHAFTLAARHGRFDIPRQ